MKIAIKKVNITIGENKTLDIYKSQMSDVKINDFWAWLNRLIPVSESLKLLDICDCDYKRLKIRKYSKTNNNKQ